MSRNKQTSTQTNTTKNINNMPNYLPTEMHLVSTLNHTAIFFQIDSCWTLSVCTLVFYILFEVFYVAYAPLTQRVRDYFQRVITLHVHHSSLHYPNEKVNDPFTLQMYYQNSYKIFSVYTYVELKVQIYENSKKLKAFPLYSRKAMYNKIYNIHLMTSLIWWHLCVKNPWRKLKWPCSITWLTGHFMCGLMFTMVIYKLRKRMVIRTWHGMSLLRSGVIKQHKPWWHLCLNVVEDCIVITTKECLDVYCSIQKQFQCLHICSAE